MSFLSWKKNSAILCIVIYKDQQIHTKTGLDLSNRNTAGPALILIEHYDNYYFLTGCEGRTKKHKPKGCVENPGLAFPSMARVPS